MKFIFVLFGILSVVCSSPPRETNVKIDLHGSQGRRGGVVVQHSGHMESVNVQVAHKHDNSARSEIEVRGAGHSGTSGGFLSASRTLGTAGTGQGKIVAYSAGIRNPGHISGKINIF